MTDVFLLGAGFSKAIHETMPLLTQLRDEARTTLMRQGYTLESWAVKPYSSFGGQMGDRMGMLKGNLRTDLHEPIGDRGNFELYLSYLSQDQPWLTEAENHRNRSEFLTYSEVIGQVLLDAQNQALQEPLPAWLRDLLMKWHQSRAVVITFNYDCLVEKAASELLKVKSGARLDYSELYPVPITSILLRRAGIFGSDPENTFQLLKLHGSINWYYSGSNMFYGEPIYDIRLKAGWSPQHGDIVADLKAKAPDKLPLIVPPTATKSAYFNNETIRSQWLLARQSIEEAENLYCIGYSFPETDVMVRSLIAWSAKRGTLCYPVNPDPEIAKRLTIIFEEDQVDTAYVGSPKAVQDFAAEYTASSTP